MMIVFVFQITGPNLYVSYELLPYLYVGVVDKCGQIVDVVTRLIKILDRHRVRVTKTYEVLKYESVVLPYSTS
jgi:hypothetical protein